MKLMDILFEDKSDKAEKPKEKPKTRTQNQSSPGVQQSVDRMINRFSQGPEKPKFASNDKVPSLKQIAKDEPPSEEDPALTGLPKFKDEPEEHPFGDPDFTMPKTREKGSYPTRFSPKSDVGKPFEPKSDPSIPSLAQLARDAGQQEPEQTPEGDPALAGLPKPNADSSEWNPNPFGDPNAGQEPDFRTGLQKGVDAIGKGIKKGFNKLKSNPLTPEPQALDPQAQSAQQVGQAMNWSPDQGVSQQAPQEPTQQEPEMPNMASLAQKQPGRGLNGKHWKWKPGQKVDIGFIKDLTVLSVDQYGAKLQAKNGGIYRFIPHRGLRKIG